jgi:hypothetical protein
MRFFYPTQILERYHCFKILRPDKPYLYNRSIITRQISSVKENYTEKLPNEKLSNGSGPLRDIIGQDGQEAPKALIPPPNPHLSGITSEQRK